MSQVKPLSGTDIDTFIDIVARAYPGIKLVNDEERQKFKERLLQLEQDNPAIKSYGLFREDKLLGGMHLFDFDVNLFGQQIQAGGVGLVAVDLLHKKEHVAKDLITFFVQHYRERGMPLAMLYPFRPDFYKQMGFGYGPKLNMYRFKPTSVPRGDSKAHVRALKPEDAPQLLDCYTRYFERTHGMIARKLYHFERVLANQENIVVGYEQDGMLQGYLVFGFTPVKPDQFMPNDLLIHEFVYESAAALRQLLTFLHSQADQVNMIMYNTHDDGFHFVLGDPRNGSDAIVNLHHESNAQGVGLMYRVIDVPGIFNVLREHNFGGQTCRLKLTLRDTFLPENAGSTIIAFEDGTATVTDDSRFDVEMRLDVSDFSSLLVGAVTFETLHRYGLVELSDVAYAGTIQRLFASDVQPQCMTLF